MDRLWLDFETYSYLNLKKVGLDRYSKDASTGVSMLGWAFNDEEVELWEPRDGDMPQRLVDGLLDPKVLKCAWNYNFEMKIMHYRLGIDIPREQWFDPSVLCVEMSLPGKLERAADALNLDIDLKKIVITGKNKPVKLFSEPSKRKKSDLKKDPTLSPLYFKNWLTDPEKWDGFREYCKQDVRAERAVWYETLKFNCPMPPIEIAAWQLDQRMNERGVWIDKAFVANAKQIALDEVNGIIAEMKDITSLENPNSGQQLGGWLRDRGYPHTSLDKEHIEDALQNIKRYKLPPLVIDVLNLKQRLGGSAYTKLQTIEDRIGPDGRLRDQFRYHGAHTGRWSGQGVQLQNLFKAIASAIKYHWEKGKLKSNRLDVLVRSIRAGKKLVTPVPPMAIIASTIRSSFAATPGNKLVVGDLAQIESRVLAALAGCQQMIDAYANGHDLYKEVMAFQLKKDVADITSEERARGKVIILGCGFGMGWEKFVEYALTYGIELSEKEAKDSVFGFREKYVEIPAFWKALQTAVIQAVKLNICVYVSGGIVVDGRDKRMLKIKLPSGRYLHYLNPTITSETTEWGAIREGVSYESWDAKGLQLKRLYGGLICENIVQAVARDILFNGMLEAEKVGFEIVMTIHDEIVGETPKTSGLGEKHLLDCMRVTPQWAEGMGFVLAAEGYECDYYKK